MIELGLIVVSFKVDEDLYNRLNKFAKNKKMNRTDVIKDAIKEFLRRGEIISDQLGKLKFTVTFKLDSVTVMELDRIAIKNKMTRSDVIRIALLQYLKKHGDFDGSNY